MSKLESWSLGKAFLVRMAIISLHVNVKIPFYKYLLSRYSRAKIHYLSKFRRSASGVGGKSAGGLPLAPTLATALLLSVQSYWLTCESYTIYKSSLQFITLQSALLYSTCMNVNFEFFIILVHCSV